LYEIALAEWHLTPDWLNANWSEELFSLMFLMRKKRYDRALAAAKKVNSTPTEEPIDWLPPDEFFAKNNIPIIRI
jgi:hypothetical protein